LQEAKRCPELRRQNEWPIGSTPPKRLGAKKTLAAVRRCSV